VRLDRGWDGALEVWQGYHCSIARARKYLDIYSIIRHRRIQSKQRAYGTFVSLFLIDDGSAREIDSNKNVHVSMPIASSLGRGVVPTSKV
jgi:hypothetical protein